MTKVLLLFAMVFVVGTLGRAQRPPEQPPGANETANCG
jgi:hypothetical protein